MNDDLQNHDKLRGQGRRVAGVDVQEGRWVLEALHEDVGDGVPRQLHPELVVLCGRRLLLPLGRRRRVVILEADLPPPATGCLFAS